MGILEANTSLNTDPVFSGLAGVLPARYVAETVKAMGTVQDKTLQGSKVPNNTGLARFGLIHTADLQL